MTTPMPLEQRALLGALMYVPSVTVEVHNGQQALVEPEQPSP